MFEDDIKITFQDLPTLDFGDKKDRVANISMNFNDVVLDIESLNDDLKNNQQALSNETKVAIKKFTSLLRTRNKHIDSKKIKKVAKDVYTDFPNDVNVRQSLINGLRHEKLDKKAVYTNDYLLKVDHMAEVLLDTYVAHDAEKSNDIDKETLARITFFKKLDTEAV